MNNKNKILVLIRVQQHYRQNLIVCDHYDHLQFLLKDCFSTVKKNIYIYIFLIILFFDHPYFVFKS